ncbi:sigma-70 family RNA polymerase sigma factor [Wenyingzhuangia sp. 2_MG-2023]|uniref:sigma-70 family RNA polymerase sigma factor n=1 Tax=Wenyingzhuangia sp. 2_MG-2023 TaxID=3062639 RepID=UPI0026E2E62D|nr:sigma-70 family RNA polymerase sigma factor [Wenyingzhuangia sp. 2_MG-2023]MDO6736384.1 sigma-70 family RNA polymerase sigma factor [Wenyingzhuangia sp. 2_MG-2023]MDO6801305.1 sigma-70 family RNA polymerase sigma factor [Wenyingzhuangia sp. 1_MG-2023]
MSNLEKTFKACYKDLCIMSFFFTKDIAEAEDVVQDVFVKIMEKQDQIKELENYLKVAVRNASLKRISKKYQSEKIDETVLFYNESNTESENELALQKKVQLYKQINLLPEQCKKIFLLCVLDDLKYKEAADALGISINTVKTQMKKAFKILRTTLKSACILYIISSQVIL